MILAVFEEACFVYVVQNNVVPCTCNCKHCCIAMYSCCCSFREVVIVVHTTKYLSYFTFLLFAFCHRRRRFWQATHGCVAPYVDIILHRGRF